MTVNELKKQLEGMPGDMPVAISEGDPEASRNSGQAVQDILLKENGLGGERVEDAWTPPSLSKRSKR